MRPHFVRRTTLVTPVGLVVTGGLALAAVGCNVLPGGPDGVIRARGTVTSAAEGCLQIVTSDHSYQPLSIPAEFRVPGLRVYFEARPKPTNNTCQAGDVVELMRIERA